jgi:N-methylhydantoinase A
MIEIVSYRLAAWGLCEKPRLPPVAPTRSTHGVPEPEKRAAVFAGHELQVQIFDRDRLAAGEVVAGPVLIEETGSTTVVPPGWNATVDGIGCLVLRRS